MSKSVLVISSSPRRGGNSDVLCDEFVRGALETGKSVEKIFLGDYSIHYCTGCGACENSTAPCAQDDDDMSALAEKMIEADVIVLASPVYFYTICAQMKTFIDRLAAQYLKITGKDFYFIVTAADPAISAMERTVECFRGLLDCLHDATEKETIYGVGVWGVGEIYNNPAMEQAFLAGKNC